MHGLFRDVKRTIHPSNSNNKRYRDTAWIIAVVGAELRKSFYAHDSGDEDEKHNLFTGGKKDSIDEDTPPPQTPV